MIQVTVETDNNEVLDLNAGGYALIQVDGLDSPQVEIVSDTVGLHDGEKVLGSRVTPRNIGLYLDLKFPVEENRVALYRFFPLKKLVHLRFRTELRDVRINGYVERVAFNSFDERMVVQIIVFCAAPFFRDSNEVITKLTQETGRFTFPFSINWDEPVPISSFGGTLARDVYNSGDTETGFVFKFLFFGPASNPVMNDEATGSHFRVNGNFVEGDAVTVSTVTGEKSVTLFRAGQNTNLINNIGPDSTWITLRLGANRFEVYADSGIENIMSEIYTNDQYIAV
jgi:hypothetical protein